MSYLYTNPNGLNKERYKNDWRIRETDSSPDNSYKPRRCIYRKERHCYVKDPVSDVYIPLLMKGENTYVCANCQRKDDIDRWFKELERREIPSTLPQFHNWKGRLIPLKQQLWDFGPGSEDPSWKFYNIMSEYEE